MYLNESTVGLCFRNQAGAAVELVFHNLCRRHERKPLALMHHVNKLAEQYNLLQRFSNVFLQMTGSLEFTVAVVDLPEATEGYVFLKQKEVDVPLSKKTQVHIEIASVVTQGRCVGLVQRVQGPSFTEVRALVDGVTVPINFASVYQAGAYLSQQQGA